MDGPAGRILIVKAGTTFPSIRDSWGDFEDWIVDGMGVSSDRVSIVSACGGEDLPEVDSAPGIVITGSHAAVFDDEPWVARLAVWVRRAVERRVPLLGICFGHQILAHAMGGQVADHPRGPEMGTASISVTGDGREDPLVSCLPDRFDAFETHDQTIVRPPDGAVTLAANDHDPRQAIRIGDRAWGVQFHPEFTVEITRAYIDECADELLDRGMDPEALKASVVDAPESRRILPRFVELIRDEGRRKRRTEAPPGGSL